MAIPTGIYGVELLYRDDPEIDGARLLGALRARLGSVDRIEGTTDGLAFAADDVQVRFSGWQTSAQIVVSPSEIPYDPALAIPSLDHTWDWPGARAAVAQATRSVVVGDFLARALAPSDRLRFVSEAVRAVVGIARPLAIDWKPAQKLVDPESTLNAPTLPFNVRYFTFTDIPGQALMDTRGLTALGLPDVQCSFTGITPEEVASHLYGIAATLVSHGSVAESHVAAAGGGRSWICRPAQAAAPPARDVLELQIQVGPAATPQAAAHPPRQVPRSGDRSDQGADHDVTARS